MVKLLVIKSQQNTTKRNYRTYLLGVGWGDFGNVLFGCYVNSICFVIYLPILISEVSLSQNELHDCPMPLRKLQMIGVPSTTYKIHQNARGCEQCTIVLRFTVPATVYIITITSYECPNVSYHRRLGYLFRLPSRKIPTLRITGPFWIHGFPLQKTNSDERS